MAETREHGGFEPGPQDDAVGRVGVPCVGSAASVDAAASLGGGDGSSVVSASLSPLVSDVADNDFGDGIDDGPGRVGKKGHLPERRCLVSGERRPVSGLIRFVRGPGGEVVPDLAAKLPGRGMWLSADREIVNTAVKRNLFSRAARAKCKADPALSTLVEAGLATRLVDLVSLARRAGEAVAGFEKSKSALNSGGAAVLIAASDSAEDGREKLARLASAVDRSRRADEKTDSKGAIATLSVLSASELGQAFAREQVVHAAVMRGGLAAKIRTEADRVRGFRQPVGDKTEERAR